jgi:N,N'-diacetyllegionaminate synthase
MPGLTLLHCVSSYPAPLSAVNLRAMQTMATEFQLPVGFSDHTEGSIAAVAAVALGACVIEKHLTLNRSLPGPDHRASMLPDEMGTLIRKIGQVLTCLGSPEKQPQPEEAEARERVRRSIVLIREKQSGSKLLASDLAILRPGTGLQPAFLENVIGRRVRWALSAGTMLRWEDLE